MGPSLEFYTMVAAQLQRKDLNMWWCDDDDDDDVDDKVGTKSVYVNCLIYFIIILFFDFFSIFTVFIKIMFIEA